MTKGVWISQQEVRNHTVPGGGHDEEILATNIDLALANLKLKSEGSPAAPALREPLGGQHCGGTDNTHTAPPDHPRAMSATTSSPSAPTSTTSRISNGRAFANTWAAAVGAMTSPIGVAVRRMRSRTS